MVKYQFILKNINNLFHFLPDSSEMYNIPTLNIIILNSFESWPSTVNFIYLCSSSPTTSDSPLDELLSPSGLLLTCLFIAHRRPS